VTTAAGISYVEQEVNEEEREGEKRLTIMSWISAGRLLKLAII